MSIHSMVQNGAKIQQPVLVRLNTLFYAHGEAVIPRGINFGLCRQIMHFFARSTIEGCLAWMEWQKNEN